jgi:hypothetical protein
MRVIKMSALNEIYSKLPAPGQSLSSIRQEWIEESVRMFREHFAANWWSVPANIRMSVGYPVGSKDGKRKLGQCIHCIYSSDATYEIFLSPDYTDTAEVLETIAHEMIHATVENPNPPEGYKAVGHKGKFKQCALAIGFKGPFTSTPSDQKMLDFIKIIVDKIGEFPAGRLNLTKRKKKGTYLLKCECPECGYVARVTAKWIDKIGTPICPQDLEPMECE